MHNEIFNMIRVALVVVLFMAGVILGTPDELVHCQDQTETTCNEPSPTPTATPTVTPTAAPTQPAELPSELPTESPTEPTYTEEELEMLAVVIYQEAGADFCSDETRLMVGTVVMNRILDERFPDTMYEVLTQKAQYGRFHWTGIIWPERASNPNEAHAVERAYTIAERILLGERALPEGVIYQAEFPQGTEVVAYSDGIYFCR